MEGRRIKEGRPVWWIVALIVVVLALALIAVGPYRDVRRYRRIRRM